LPVLDQAGYAGIAILPTAAATATDLMVFKMLCNRRKDWADIESLLRCSAGDSAEAVEWGSERSRTRRPAVGSAAGNHRRARRRTSRPGHGTGAALA